MSKKAILLQIEILYHVPEYAAEDCYARDVQHFDQIGKDIASWATQTNEVREPIDFQFRHSLGEVVDEEE